MGDIKIVQGGISTDFRGAISHVNDLDMSESGALLCHTAKRSVDHPGMARTSNGEEVVLRIECGRPFIFQFKDGKLMNVFFRKTFV